MTWPGHSLSFRARLTLRWTLSFAVLLAFVGFIVYVGTATFSRRDLDEQVRSIAQHDLLTASQVTDRGRLFEDPDWAFHDFGFIPVHAQLLASDGRVANATRDLAGAPPLLQPREIAAASKGTLPIVTVSVQDRELRVLAVPVVRDGQHFVLAMGVSEDPMHERLLPLAMFLGSVWLGGVVLTGMLGFALASRALRPIDNITRRASAIAHGEFGARLDPPQVDDEIGRMTRLFNDVLDRLHGAIETNRHFAGDASHELRTPLTALQGEVDVALKRDRPASEYKETLELVRDGLRHMGEVTENLMVLVRAQERAAERIVEEVPLAPLIDSAIERARVIAAPRGTTISSGGMSNLVLYGDARLYARVFENLIVNAVHYNRDEGSVVISARCVEAPSDEWTSDRIVVSVADTGIGIPPEEWTRIFERFRRLESSRHRRRGAGLGLAICREVVTLYGGGIRVVRSSSEGTTFEVDLPGRQTMPRGESRPEHEPAAAVGD